MTFRDMFYLQTLARCRSYSQAAKELIISQPALSQTIRQLEDEYHIKIFVYQNRSLTLTEAGHILLNSAERILNLQNQIQKHFLQVSQRTPAVNLIFSSDLEHVFEFMSLQNLTQTPINAYFVHQNRLDSNIWDFKLSIEKHMPDLNSILLCQEKMGILLPNDHPLSDSENISLNDLLEYPILLPSMVTLYRKTIQKIFSEHNFDPVIAMESDNYASYPVFLSGRSWIALIPEISTGLQNESGFKLIPWKDYPEEYAYSIYLTANPKKALSSHAQQIGENLIHYFRKASL